jgi:hypothetical protein
MNDIADAPSRQFNCPSGPAVRQLLQAAPRLTISAVLKNATLAISQMQQPNTSLVAQQALITAARITGTISALSGAFTHI